MESIKVSVIIPTYKRPDNLVRAVSSVLRQTHKNIEVIIVDDNTAGDQFREETEALLKSSGYDSNPKIIYKKHKVNKNGSAARNTGLRAASGDYIAFLDDDDEFFDSKISQQVSFLETKSSEYGGVCSNFLKKYNGNVYKVGHVEEKVSGSYLFELLSGTADFGAGSTLMIRRDVIETVGFFDETYSRHQDWEFLIRFFRNYKLGYMPKILTTINADGFRNYPSPQKLILVKEKLIREFEQDFDSLGREQKYLLEKHQYKEIAKVFFQNAKFSDGFAFIKSKQEYGFSRLEILRLMLFVLWGRLNIVKSFLSVLLSKTIYRQYT